MSTIQIKSLTQKNFQSAPIDFMESGEKIGAYHITECLMEEQLDYIHEMFPPILSLPFESLTPKNCVVFSSTEPNTLDLLDEDVADLPRVCMLFPYRVRMAGKYGEKLVDYNITRALTQAELDYIYKTFPDVVCVETMLNVYFYDTWSRYSPWHDLSKAYRVTDRFIYRAFVVPIEYDDPYYVPKENDEPPRFTVRVDNKQTFAPLYEFSRTMKSGDPTPVQLLDEFIESFDQLTDEELENESKYPFKSDSECSRPKKTDAA